MKISSDVSITWYIKYQRHSKEYGGIEQLETIEEIPLMLRLLQNAGIEKATLVEIRTCAGMPGHEYIKKEEIDLKKMLSERQKMLGLKPSPSRKTRKGVR